MDPKTDSALDGPGQCYYCSTSRASNPLFPRSGSVYYTLLQFREKETLVGICSSIHLLAIMPCWLRSMFCFGFGSSSIYRGERTDTVIPAVMAISLRLLRSVALSFPPFLLLPRLLFCFVSLRCPVPFLPPSPSFLCLVNCPSLASPSLGKGGRWNLPVTY